MKTIIEMALEAGFAFDSLGGTYTTGSLSRNLEDFAELVRADERAVLALETERNRNSTFALQLRARGNT